MADLNRLHRLGLSDFPPVVTTQTIPNGDPGSIATLKKMRQLVNGSLTDPVVINTAKSLIRFIPPRSYRDFVGALQEFLSQHVLFCRDPRGVELLHTPRYMIDTIANRFYLQADCDDVAILAAALGKALGMSARFVALGFQTEAAPLTHVFTEIGIPSGEWYALDTTKQPSALEPTITRIKRMDV